MNVVNFKDKFLKFSEHWSPKIVGQLNDYHIKLVKIQGDFVWHSHAETDEAFIVIEGELGIDFRDRQIILHPGEMIIVPKGVEHKPFAKNECKMMLIEPVGTINTGDVKSELTAEVGWI